MLAAKLREIILPIASHYAGRVFVTEGNVRDRGMAVRFLYFGDYITRPYLGDMAYDTPPATCASKLSLFSNIHSLLDEYKPDIALVHMPEKYTPLLERYTSYKTVHEVSQAIDVSGSWEEVKSQFGRSRKTFANQVESKYGLGHRVSTDESDFKKFYYDMHTPYMEKRFNSEYRKLDSYSDMKSYFDRGFVIMVTHEGKDVAGVLSVVEGDSLAFRRVGILNGSQEHNDAKAQMALYYYSIVVARQKHLKYMNAMGSQPFFNDGVYQSKWRWGASIKKEEHASHNPYFVIPRHSENVVDFFSKYPAIIEKDKGLFGLLGREQSGPLNEQETKTLRKSYYANGLQGMVLLGKTPEETFEHLFS